MRETELDGMRIVGRRMVTVVLVLVGLGALVTTVAVATHLMRSLSTDAGVSPAAPASAETPVRTRMMVAPPLVALAQRDHDVVHADLYFDFKSTRLRADAVRILQEQAARMDHDSVWTVLVQGYADRRGPAEYNRLLAGRRAETVRQFLSELGVPEGSIHTVTIGPDGALCEDPSPECRQLNRRVHLEIRKLGQAAAAALPATADPADVFEAPPSGNAAPAAGH
jgi:outer membrane protein OmpA-like peptidoglycan-associated protein